MVGFHGIFVTIGYAAARCDSTMLYLFGRLLTCEQTAGLGMDFISSTQVAPNGDSHWRYWLFLVSFVH
jgi:hypothetical protein